MAIFSLKITTPRLKSDQTKYFLPNFYVVSLLCLLSLQTFSCAKLEELSSLRGGNGSGKGTGAGSEGDLANSPAKPTSRSVELNVLTYNIWGLYPAIGGKAPWRYEAIGKTLSSYDLVAVQEAWDKQTEAVMDNAGFAHKAYGDGVHKLVGGSGLVTLSRYPILESDTLTYDECAGFDCFAKKQALRTRIALPNGRLLDVYNTHLNAFFKVIHDKGSEVRSSQIIQLSHFIKMKSADIGNFLVMGDFNADEGSENYFEMESGFDAIDLFRVFDPVTPICTYCAGDNTWIPGIVEKFHGSARFDYIWAGEGDRFDIDNAEVAYSETVLAPVTQRKTKYKKVGPPSKQRRVPAGEAKPEEPKFVHLSDHYGIRANVTLR